MFVPIYDENPLRHFSVPLVTRLLVSLNFAIYVVFQSGLVLDASMTAAISFGIVPAAITGGTALPVGYRLIPPELTLFTYMFLHGHWLHLIGNSLFLWVFGDNVEDALGRFRFLIFYLLCGAAGGFAHVLAMPESNTPLVGSSGAIAGVVAAYLMLHPRVKVWVLLLMRVPLKLRAIWLLGAWIILQFASALMLSDSKDQTAWWAHVGGLAAGALLVIFLRRPGVALFDRNIRPDVRSR